jgi:sugar phosphate isomerase/epimerase
VPYGAGVSDVPALLTELKAQGFAGNISIEYEYHWENSTPEVGQCIGFVRGYGMARKW